MTATTQLPFGACCPPDAPNILLQRTHNFYASIVRWKSRRNDVWRLRSLSDYYLKDLGISRSEICSVAYSQPCEHRL